MGEKQTGEASFVFSNETSIHGVKEAATSPVKFHRYVWLAVMGVAFIAMAFQMQQVATSFAGDESGTRFTGYVPSELPGVMFCPRFHAFKPYSESGITEQMGRYFNGYFTFGTEYHRALDVLNGMEENPGTPETIGDVEERIRSFNSSVQRFLLANALEQDDIIRDIEVLPPSLGSPVPKDARVLFTYVGLCYLFQLGANVDAKLAQFATLSIIVGDRYVPITHREMNALYLVFVGNFDTLAVAPPVSGRIYLPRSNHINLKVRIMRKIRYPGRLGKRCRNYKKSDENYCISEALFQRFCDKCRTTTPASSSYAEAVRKPEEFCNYYHRNRSSCFPELTSSNFEEVSKACPPPCDEQVFDYTTQISTANWTGLSLSFDNLALSATMVEYPLVTLTDFLSSTGGTMGLYFGASLLSMFQVFFYCGATARKCCQGANTNAYAWK